MLLYALLHLCGVKAEGQGAGSQGGLAVTLEDIERFRQLDSKCAGHPEHGLTTGVETTTGPLGQGCATTVGMAIAANWLAGRYNRPDYTLFDYDIYALCSDGDMMEGVSSETASLAGHLQLGNLCWIYDNNHVTIEGHTQLAFNDDVGARFRAYGWSVHHVADANDLKAIAGAFDAFRRDHRAPTLIVVDSHIGYGSPHKQDTSAAHGEPLGDEEVRLTKRFYGWPEDAQFLVPDGVREHFAAGIGRRGAHLREDLARHAGGLCEKIPGARRGADADPAPRVAGRMERQPAELPRRRQGDGDPRRFVQGDERHRAKNPLADRRRGRPRALDQHQAELRRGRRLRTGLILGPQPAFRHSRTRHGREPQWHRLVRRPRLWLDLPDLQRLSETGVAAFRADGAAGHLYLHP